MDWMSRIFIGVIALLSASISNASDFKGVSVLALLDTQQIGKIVRYKVTEACQPSYAHRLAMDGFNAVRLVIIPVPIIQPDEGGRSLAGSQIIDCGKSFKDEGLDVIYDITQDKKSWSLISAIPAPETLLANDVYASYETGIVQLAAELAKNHDQGDMLEILNEPPRCEPGREFHWDEVQPKVYSKIRLVAPKLKLLLSGCGGQLWSLLELNPSPYSSDENAYFSFHFYEPFTFTHQFGNKGIKLRGIPYPPLPSDFASVISTAQSQINSDNFAVDSNIRQQLLADVISYMKSGFNYDKAKQSLMLARHWATDNGIDVKRVIMGEFAAGIYTTAKDVTEGDAKSQLNWIGDIARASKESGISSFFWFYPAPRHYWWNQTSGGMKKELLDALGVAKNN